ncbi:MAG: RNA pyrophosphohydrolase [Alphaproteobacteria bacterium MarineAlpha2_Bin1]|nr:MAG: RNA pyrophosphohydrolase [Alphaproteobacteria bacterium MarineAlpha2_Bin1]|tara:strand:- start:473 stop:946 length:474 start_codon:yes stop_codon:yes gene_type:complete
MNNYRPCVGIMLLNSKNMVLVGKRLDSNDDLKPAWQMPQGGINKDEKPNDAALRELKEEIGTNNAHIICEYKKWLRYDLPEELRKSLWKGKYTGQEQKWFAMRFLGKDSEIDINTSEPEFKDWKWIKAEDLVSVVVPFKRCIYKTLINRLFSEAIRS